MNSAFASFLLRLPQEQQSVVRAPTPRWAGALGERVGLEYWQDLPGHSPCQQVSWAHPPLLLSLSPPTVSHSVTVSPRFALTSFPVTVSHTHWPGLKKAEAATSLSEDEALKACACTVSYSNVKVGLLCLCFVLNVSLSDFSAAATTTTALSPAPGRTSYYYWAASQAQMSRRRTRQRADGHAGLCQTAKAARRRRRPKGRGEVGKTEEFTDHDEATAAGRGRGAPAQWQARCRAGRRASSHWPRVPLARRPRPGKRGRPRRVHGGVRQPRSLRPLCKHTHERVRARSCSFARSLAATRTKFSEEGKKRAAKWEKDTYAYVGYYTGQRGF